MDLNTIYENAIKQGMTNPEEWMYMYSDNDYDFFKNCNSRKYINFKKKAMSEDEELHEHIKLLTNLAFCVSCGFLEKFLPKEENNE